MNKITKFLLDFGIDITIQGSLFLYYFMNNHNFSIGNLKQLKSRLKKQNTQDAIAINIICDIIKDIQHAKKLGQRMENRLKKYRRFTF